MHVDVRRAGDVIIVDLRGGLVSEVAENILRPVVDELLGQRWQKILLNLSAVDRIDSAGIGELVESVRLADRFGSSIRLVRIHDRVRQSLSISKILPLLKVYENEQEALQSFNADAHS